MASLMLRFQRSHAQNAGSVVGQLPGAIAPAAPLTGLPAGHMAGQQLAALCTASLTEDLRALKDVSSHASRDITKRDVLIPKYADYVHRLREAGHSGRAIVARAQLTPGYLVTKSFQAFYPCSEGITRVFFDRISALIQWTPRQKLLDVFKRYQRWQGVFCPAHNDPCQITNELCTRFGPLGFAEMSAIR